MKPADNNSENEEVKSQNAEATQDNVQHTSNAEGNPVEDDSTAEGNPVEGGSATENNQAEGDSATAEPATEQDPLEAAKAEIEELKKQALYKQAEFENYRKRTLKEKADLILGGAEKTVKEILPVLDDFERAMADKSEDPAAIKQGMELIYNKFQKILESMGVKKIDTKDADFNVDYHESIALVPGMGEDKKGKVIDCVQTGYTLNDKVIRFAKVAVGQ